MTHGTRNITRKYTVSRWPTVTLSYRIGQSRDIYIYILSPYLSKLCFYFIDSFILPLLSSPKFPISIETINRKIVANFQRERERGIKNVCRKICKDSVAKQWIEKTKERGSLGVLEDVARILMQAVFDSAKQTASRQKLSTSQSVRGGYWRPKYFVIPRG